jgi:hypothetical protein
MIFMVKERCATDSSPLLLFHQNICGLRKKTDELINSSFPKFSHTLCFSEHHLKQIELKHINLEGYKLGSAYCRKSLLKDGDGIFAHKKHNYSNVDLSKYCKEHDIEACALKLELIALNIYVVTVYRAPCGNFTSFLKDNERNKQLDAVLLLYNLTATVLVPIRLQNQSNMAVDNIFIDNYKFTKYTVSPIYNGLSDHDAQLLTIKDINLQQLLIVVTVLEI